MSFNSVRLNFNIVLLVLLGVYNRGNYWNVRLSSLIKKIVSVDFIMAYQCYVCGPDANISCDKFDPSNKSFIKDCPSAKSCIIKTHGKYWITPGKNSRVKPFLWQEIQWKGRVAKNMNTIETVREPTTSNIVTVQQICVTKKQPIFPTMKIWLKKEVVQLW